ncbi:dihydropteroate synthase [Arcanobacterium haemolyticum]|nr:dihydropteroate synthase [Arcanobacterium haemolyticum]
MGILNVTPDSFSDGGRWNDVDAAIAQGYKLIHEGADIIDIGGESTRPGARMLEPDEEWDRIGAVVRALSQTSTPISVDTYHATTARRAIEAGATIINDVTGGAGDPSMLSTVAALGCPYILQHGRGNPQTMGSLASYTSVSREVADELREGLERAIAVGINTDNIVVDPGFGFAKDSVHNWDLAANFDAIEELGFPILVGVSRKRFLAELEPASRDDVTAALTSYFAQRGVWGVRVHAVAPSRAGVLTAQTLRVHKHTEPRRRMRRGPHGDEWGAA